MGELWGWDTDPRLARSLFHSSCWACGMTWRGLRGIWLLSSEEEEEGWWGGTDLTSCGGCVSGVSAGVIIAAAFSGFWVGRANTKSDRLFPELEVGL